MRPGVFLDRDGVINRNRIDHVKSWSEFEFLPGALEALKRLAGLDLPVVVVTNQAAIGRGLIDAAEVDEIHRRMIEAVRLFGGRIDAVLCCPHRPDEGCECRKPKPVIVRTGRGAAQIEQLGQAEAGGFVVVEDLGSAVEWITSHTTGSRGGW
jgi:D-glycero-D-manno-heptose 1,7-bisphosphate phosphatase